ncbi:hypothetical protein Tco_1010180 [Tanacetum coccineum]
MSASNQQTLADSRANERPPILEKWNYIPWESRFIRFLDNKLKEGERMWCSIEKGPYVRPIIPDPDDTREQIIKPLSKMIEINKKQYIAYVRVMNYLLQAIPNDIYNSMDACKTAQEMWERIKSAIRPYVQASKGKRAAMNHGPLALITHSNASSSQSHVISSYSHSPQPYYVIHPLSVVDYEEDYQGKNQAVIQDGGVDIQAKNTGYGGNGNRNAWRQNKNQAFNARNGLTQYDEINMVSDTKDTIKFKLDSQEITYTVEMFCDTLKLPEETLDNPFIAPVNIKVIESFMQTVGYQGVVDKVGSFYTKFLAQPWQTMFKVFNRCLTTQTSGHDQTNINILQLFHDVVNRTNIDYTALLWWDFINCIF